MWIHHTTLRHFAMLVINTIMFQFIKYFDWETLIFISIMFLKTDISTIYAPGPPSPLDWHVAMSHHAYNMYKRVGFHTAQLQAHCVVLLQIVGIVFWRILRSRHAPPRYLQLNMYYKQHFVVVKFLKCLPALSKYFKPEDYLILCWRGREQCKEIFAPVSVINDWVE